MYIPQCAYPFIHRWIFALLSLFSYCVNNVAKNMGVQIALQDLVFKSFEYMPRNVIAGLYGIIILCLIFLRNHLLLSAAAVSFCIPTSIAQGF